MIYDVIYSETDLSNHKVQSFSNFNEARREAGFLALKNKQVYVSLRLGTFKVKSEWFPIIIDTLDGSNLLDTLK